VTQMSAAVICMAGSGTIFIEAKELTASGIAGGFVPMIFDLVSNRILLKVF